MRTPKELLYLLSHAQHEIAALRQTVAELTPKAQAFDLLVHTHLGTHFGDAVHSDVHSELSMAIDEIMRETDAAAKAAELKAAEKAKAGKVRKPRKPKAEAPPTPANEPNPPADADPQPETAAAQSEGGRRRTRFFGASQG